MKALVTGMMTPVGLFTVRRLCEMGFDVTAGGCTNWDYAMYSKGVKRRILFPSTRYQPAHFAEAVLNEIRRGQYDIYIPTFEDGFLMSYFQEEINRHTRFLAMPYHQILAAHDKGIMRRVAPTVGVPVPDPTVVPGSRDEAESALKTWNYPSVIKLRKACGAHGQQIIHDPSLVRTAYWKLVSDYKIEESELPIIQRFIRGPLICTVDLAHEGTLVGQVAFKALRTYPRTGGTCSYKEIVDVPKVRQYDAALIRRLNWTGFFCTDYMMDQETGEFYLIDCNPRMAPGIIIGHHAGTDLFGAYVDMALERPIQAVQDPKAGIRGRMQFLELGWILDSLLDRSMLGAEKRAAWKEWRRQDAVCDDVLSWKDPRPGIVLYSFIFSRLRRLLSEHGGELFLKHVLFEEERFATELKGRAGELQAAAAAEAERI